MGEYATKSVSGRGVDQRMVRFANKRPKTGLFRSLFAKRTTDMITDDLLLLP